MDRIVGEPRYDVVWPLSNKAVSRAEAAPRLGDLNGKTICELWDGMFRGESIYPLLRDFLRGHYPRVNFVEYSEFGKIDIDGPRERQVLAALSGALRRHGCDAAIVGVGA